MGINRKHVKSALKKALPEYKFSVRGDSGSLKIAMISGVVDFTGAATVVNEFSIDRKFAHNIAQRDVLAKIYEIISTLYPIYTEFHDSDYGNIPNYYFTLEVGEWNNPYVFRGEL